MGERLSASEVGRYRRDGLPLPTDGRGGGALPRPECRGGAAPRGGPAKLRLAMLRLAIVLLACLVASGCAGSSRSDDDNRFGGLYGGLSGGVAP